MERPIPHLLLKTAFALLVGCQPAEQNQPAPEQPGLEQPAPEQPAPEQPAPEQSPRGAGGGHGGGAGGGQGGGAGGGDGGGQSGECGSEIVLTLDGEVVWRRTRDELAADPAVAPIAGYRDGDVLGVRIRDLLAGLESIRSALIRSCGARGFEFSMGQLRHAPLYLQRGGSGRWRLVDFADPDVPTVFIRDVAHIEASSQATAGGDSPGN